jgi:hypothetical protein
MNLLEFRNNLTSQYGEDGVIAKIFEVLQISKGTCVEFGAWDGKTYSNTYNLVQNKGWRAVLIEGSVAKFGELRKTFQGHRDVTTINRMVGFESPHLLDEILSKTSIPFDFDFLSIDVDGNDYHSLATITTYRPKVFVIEFNPSIPNHVHFVQARDMNVNQGASLASITTLAKQRGYELIACTDINAFYVDRQYFPRFEIADNSLDALHQDRSYQTVLFQCYDGTLRIAGCNRMIWHGIAIDEERLQILPRELRRFPGAV